MTGAAVTGGEGGLADSVATLLEPLIKGDGGGPKKLALALARKALEPLLLKHCKPLTWTDLASALNHLDAVNIRELVAGLPLKHPKQLKAYLTHTLMAVDEADDHMMSAAKEMALIKARSAVEAYLAELPTPAEAAARLSERRSAVLSAKGGTEAALAKRVEVLTRGGTLYVSVDLLKHCLALAAARELLHSYRSPLPFSALVDCCCRYIPGAEAKGGADGKGVQLTWASLKPALAACSVAQLTKLDADSLSSSAASLAVPALAPLPPPPVEDDNDAAPPTPSAKLTSITPGGGGTAKQRPASAKAAKAAKPLASSEGGATGVAAKAKVWTPKELKGFQREAKANVRKLLRQLADNVDGAAAVEYAMALAKPGVEAYLRTRQLGMMRQGLVEAVTELQTPRALELLRLSLEAPAEFLEQLLNTSPTAKTLRAIALARPIVEAALSKRDGAAIPWEDMATVLQLMDLEALEGLASPPAIHDAAVASSSLLASVMQAEEVDDDEVTGKGVVMEAAAGMQGITHTNAVLDELLASLVTVTASSSNALRLGASAAAVQFAMVNLRPEIEGYLAQRPSLSYGWAEVRTKCAKVAAGGKDTAMSTPSEDATSLMEAAAVAEAAGASSERLQTALVTLQLRHQGVTQGSGGGANKDEEATTPPKVPVEASADAPAPSPVAAPAEGPVPTPPDAGAGVIAPNDDEKVGTTALAPPPIIANIARAKTTSPNAPRAALSFDVEIDSVLTALGLDVPDTSPPSAGSAVTGATAASSALLVMTRKQEAKAAVEAAAQVKRNAAAEAAKVKAAATAEANKAKAAAAAEAKAAARTAKAAAAAAAKEAAAKAAADKNAMRAAAKALLKTTETVEATPAPAAEGEAMSVAEGEAPASALAVEGETPVSEPAAEGEAPAAEPAPAAELAAEPAVELGVEQAAEGEALALAPAVVSEALAGAEVAAKEDAAVPVRIDGAATATNELAEAEAALATARRNLELSLQRHGGSGAASLHAQVLALCPNHPCSSGPHLPTLTPAVPVDRFPS